MKNLHLKVLSIVIAVSLWFGLVSGEYQEFSVYAPVKLRNMQGELVAVTPDTHVNVFAKTPRAFMSNLDYNAVVVDVDVSSLTFGDTYHKILASEVKLPSGVELVRVDPEGLRITVDRLVKKPIKIVPTFIGEPHPGFKVNTVTVYPENVEIQGATKKLQNVSSIETKPVNLSTKKEAMTYSIGIKETDGVLSSSPEQVEVYVNFTENIIELTVDDLPVVAENIRSDLEANIKGTVTAKIKGRSDLLSAENLTKRVKFYVDLGGISTPGNYYLNVQVSAPDNYKINKITPQKVSVKISRKG